MPTIVRQATIADRDAIAEFIKIAYGSRSRFIVPDRWDWQYRDHPLIDQSQQNLNIWIAIKDDKVVGQICGWPVDLKVKDVTHRALWGCDLMVLPVCRGEGIAGRLARGLIDHCGLFIGIMQTPVARHIYEKMGCVDLEPVPVHGRLCRFDRGFVHEVVSRRLATRPRLQKLAAIAGRYLLLDWFVALAGNVALRLRDLFQRRAKPRDRTEVREVDCFGEDIDRLWNATKDQFEVIGHRDRQFANWRFTANKQINYRKYIAVRDGETTGYLVLRHPHAVEMGWGFIVDLYAARGRPGNSGGSDLQGD